MLSWVCKKFDLLSPREVYSILQLRNAVFVVEQQCIFQDADDKDQLSFHFMGWEDDRLVAYTRLLPPGLAYEEAGIGRVVTAVAARGTGAGKQLMENSIKECRNLFGKDIKIRIGAQLYLQKFYASFGFIPIGEIYMEDGIQHVEMLLS
jgi:ElaA protein